MPRSDLLELPDESIAEIASVFDRAAPQVADGQSQTGGFFQACERVASADRIRLEMVGPLPSELDEIELLEYVSSRANFR